MMSVLKELLSSERARAFISGAPGLAKTTRIAALARELGWRYFYGVGDRSVDMCDRLDLAGAVWPDAIAGVARLLPLEALQEIRECTEPAILVLDEIGRADLPEQGAISSMLDWLTTHRPNVRVVGITNRAEDGAGVRHISTQLHSRLGERYSIATPGCEEQADGTVYLLPWYDATGREESEGGNWLNWATDAGADPFITSYHRATACSKLWQRPQRPRHDVAYPDFRGWELIMRQRAAGCRSLQRTSAAIGKQAAVDYCAWEALADKLVPWQTIVTDPEHAPVPSERDPDALHLTVAHLARASTPQLCGAVGRYLLRLPLIFAAILGRDLVRAPQGDGADAIARRTISRTFSTDPSWISWLRDNQAVYG